MTLSCDNIAKYYKWTLDYTTKVTEEYYRFLILRSKNNKLSPPDDIDKVWHYHILSTEKYAPYCIKNFGTLVHHNPEDSFDQKERNVRLNNTLLAYKSVFGAFKYPEIWFPNTLLMPSLKTKIKPYHIGVFVYYTYDTGRGVRKWRVNENKYDRKIITCAVTPHMTVSALKELISKTTKYDKIATRIYLHPSSKFRIHDVYPKAATTGYKNEAKSGWINELDSNIPLLTLLANSQNLLIAELEEMTSHGYC